MQIEQFLFPAMMAAAVAMLAWWGTVMLSAFSSEKRKLAARLSNAGPKTGGPNLSNLSVILPEDGANVPRFLARKPYIQSLQRKMSHAFPNMTLQRFLCIDAAMGILPALAILALFQNPAPPVELSPWAAICRCSSLIPFAAPG